MYLLGIDIGTSSCKVALFTANGHSVAQAMEKYPTYRPQAGWAEQDPNDWWSSVCQAIKKMLVENKIAPHKIAGIGIDGQSWAAIPIDINGKVLCKTPIWMDTRAADICQELEEKIGSKAIFDLCGNPLKPSYSLPKVLWYKKHFPALYQQIDKVLQSNSYIAYCLTGTISQDISQGYGYHCFDMRKGRWDHEMCLEMGLQMNLLPEIVKCHEIIGKVTEKAALQTGLTVGTPVVAGGLDAACGALGVGVLQAGETQEQGGQAGGMSICTDTYCADERLILSHHVTSDKWLLQGGTVGGGGILNWFEKEFGHHERQKALANNTSSFEELSKLAAAVPAGSEGLIFLPYMAGERSPIWDVNAKGVYFGLDFSKTKSHMIRASMEGVAFSLKHNLAIAEAAGVKVDTLRAMGGAANSCLWTQIKCDITGKPIEVTRADTATTLGAAMLAGVAVGIYRDFEDAVSQTKQLQRTHEPISEHATIYQKNYQVYLQLYEQLKTLMV